MTIHTSFNRDIINDCLRLHRVFSIPWLNYIRNFMTDIGHPEYFARPDSIVSISKKTLKVDCLAHLQSNRLSLEIVKPSVLENQMLMSWHGLQPYLVYVSGSYDRMLLTHFCLGSFHRLTSFPVTDVWSKNLDVCPCDDLSQQSMMHILLFK